jgi:protocatechuate 3,4-dioxygenase beta subunit
VPERLAASKSESIQPRPGEHVRVRITLTHGATVAGRVVDEEGDPVEGAALEVRVDTIIYGQGGVIAREAETAADGTFRLSAVPVGESLLAFERQGFIAETEDLDLLEGQVVDELELVLSRGRRVSGRVVWPDGAPAAGADVSLSFDMSQMGGMAAFNAMTGAEGEALTDDDGAFAITGLGNGPFTVRATIARTDEGTTATEDDGGRLWQARADGVRPDRDGMQESERIELELQPPLGFAGRVVDGSGRPVQRFTVHARSEEGGLFATFGSDQRSAGFETEDGTFFLDGLRPGEWQVAAASEGFGTPEPLKVLLPRSDDAEHVQLSLYRVATVSGTMLDPEGRPVGGAEVGRQKSVQEMRRSGLLGDDLERARTDKEGRFTIEGITPGGVSLVAEAADYAESEPVAIEVEPSGAADGVVLTLRVGGRLVGEVYDAEGKPESGRAILAQRPSALGLQRWTRSDAEGRFAIEHMVPGSYQVLAMPDQETVEGERGEDDFTSIFAEMRLTMAEIRDEEETFVQLGSPPGDPVRVHGKVVLDGEGVPDVMVNFVPDGGESSMRYATTDARGGYEVEVASPGRYMVSMQKVGGTGQSQSLVVFEEVPETDEHRLNLTLPVGRITGRVIGADGAPAVKERVTLFTDGARLDGNYAEAQTDEDGNYDLTWLRGGTYSIAAGGVFMGGVIGEATGNGRQIKSDVRLREGEWLRDVDFRMREAGRLEGRVVDETGNPVAEASIYLYDESGRRIEAFSTVVTDGTGRFEYEGVQPGAYSVRARTKGRATPEPVLVRLREGETTRTELKLDTGTTLVVKLVDEAGEPLQAAVEVFDESGQEVGGLLSLSEILEIFMQGRFSSTEPRIGPLPAGRYTVEAEAADGRSAKKLVTLSGQEERTVRLRLR